MAGGRRDDGSKPSGKRRQTDAVRTVNAVIAAVLGCFFLFHAIMGAYTAGRVAAPLTALWAGLAGIVFHVAFCIATSVRMLTDDVRPPSRNKKRHLLLKWVTGAVLLVVLATHLPGVPIGGLARAALSAALVLALAVHLFVGAKSLLKDVGLSSSGKVWVRVAAGIATGVALLGMLLQFV
jgi:hypothetical protein